MTRSGSRAVIVTRASRLRRSPTNRVRRCVSSHQGFKKKYELPFPLLADTEGMVCAQYGVLKENEFHGKKYMGIERSTFIIDETGKITHAYRGVKIEGHVRELLDKIGG